MKHLTTGLSVLLLVAGCDRAAESGAAREAAVTPDSVVRDTPPEAEEVTDTASRDAYGEKPYIALGQEPGWRVIISDETLTVEKNYGSEKIVAPRPLEQFDGDARIYRAATLDNEITVEVTLALCHDIMSGMPYPDTVRVLVDDEQLNGCGGDPRDLFIGGEWILTSLSTGKVNPGIETTIGFGAEGSVSGSGGCNRFSGAYTLTGEGLTIGPVAATKRACAEAGAMEQEQRFFDFLGALQRFDIDAATGQLKLISDSNAIAILRRPE